MYSYKSTVVIVIDVLLPLLASGAVALRFKARRCTKAGFTLDDYVMLLALIVLFALIAMIIYGAVHAGIGDSLRNYLLDPEESARFSEILFAGPFLFALIITLIKISTLLLYKRIFVRKGFHLVCNVLMTLVIGWFLASILGQAFSRKPISSGIKSLGNNAFNWPVFAISRAVINLALDFIVVLLPLFVIRTLRMTLRRKIQVSGIFLLGLFCIFASAIRLYWFVALSITHNKSIIDVLTNDFLWSCIEPCTSIIAACLPTYGPLFQGGRDSSLIKQAIRSILPLRGMAFQRSHAKGNQSTFIDLEETNEAKSAWQKLYSEPGRTDVFTRRNDIEMGGLKDTSSYGNWRQCVDQSKIREIDRQRNTTGTGWK